MVAKELGASFVALNPLHAIHNAAPSIPVPTCRTASFIRISYLDIEGMEDFKGCRRARCARPALAGEIEALRLAVRRIRTRRGAQNPFPQDCLRSVSARVAHRFFARRSSKASAGAKATCSREFATYCALDESLHRQNPDLWLWTEWPAPYQDPCSPETREFRRKHWRSVMFYQYLQWQIDLQLARAQQHARDRHLSIGLYHDLALATDRFGSDLWAHRPFYVAGCRVGSPPDDFSPKGQDWAFPPPNAARHREDGYRLFAESIRKNCRHGGALRIDHVMRLFRLFWIPDGSDATHGAYVRERNHDFVRILALESVRNQVIVVGEDLGTVEPSIRETLASFGILSYRLFYFEKNERGEFRRTEEYPTQALVSSTTHDLPTLPVSAGFTRSHPPASSTQARRARLKIASEKEDARRAPTQLAVSVAARAPAAYPG